MQDVENKSAEGSPAAPQVEPLIANITVSREEFIELQNTVIKLQAAVGQKQRNSAESTVNNGSCHRNIF